MFGRPGFWHGADFSVAGDGRAVFNFATYACNSFLVPMLQRYFLMPLQEAAVATGVIVGVTGLVGLTGWLGRGQDPSAGRQRTSAVCRDQPDHIDPVPGLGALHSGRIEIGVFVAVFSLGWLFAYNFYTCVYTAIQDVVEPRLRATAVALFFAGTCWALDWGRWWWARCPITSPIPRCCRRCRNR